MASASCSAPTARAIRATPSSSRCRRRAAFPKSCRCPWPSRGSYSPDGKRMVYQPLDGGQFSTDTNNFVSWKRYRGGRASYLWIVNFADLSTQKIPRTDSNDFNAMWIGDKIYFLSDRNGPVTLFRYDPQSKKVDELIKNTGKDIIYASAGPGGIVYEQFGADPHLTISRAARSTPCPSRSRRTSPRCGRTSRTSPARFATSSISPTGVRAVFEAHGEILTAPAEKGDIRNLTNYAGRDGADARLVAGRPVDRLLLRRIGRVRAAHQAAERARARRSKIPLAGKSAYYFEPQVVARQQAHRLRRQSAQPVGRGDRLRQADQGGHRLHQRARHGLHLVAATPSGSPMPSPCPTASAPSRSGRWRAGRASR